MAILVKKLLVWKYFTQLSEIALLLPALDFLSLLSQPLSQNFSELLHCIALSYCKITKILQLKHKKEKAFAISIAIYVADFLNRYFILLKASAMQKMGVPA